MTQGFFVARAWRKQAKAEAKLGPHFERPKGMHNRTRERLLSIIGAVRKGERWRSLPVGLPATEPDASRFPHIQEPIREVGFVRPRATKLIVSNFAPMDPHANTRLRGPLACVGIRT
jgi:hypothetical protein